MTDLLSRATRTQFRRKVHRCSLAALRLEIDELEPERAAGADLTVDTDSSTMRLDEPLADV